jgi:hypothetical protein
MLAIIIILHNDAKNKDKVEIRALLGYYAASSGTPLPTFRWQSFTAVSGQRICPIFKGEKAQEERRSHQNRGGNPKSRKDKVVYLQVIGSYEGLEV